MTNKKNADVLIQPKNTLLVKIESPTKVDGFTSQLPLLRHNARQFALQAVYQWQMTRLAAECIEVQFLERYIEKIQRAQVDLLYFKQLIYGTIEAQACIDKAICPFLKRSLQEIDYIELAVLRLATYELIYQPSVPYPVIINEALKLAKSFGSSDGYRFVNGVLDRVAKKNRPILL